MEKVIKKALLYAGYKVSDINKLMILVNAISESKKERAIEILIGEFEFPDIPMASSIDKNAILENYHPLSPSCLEIEYTYEAKKKISLLYDPKKYESNNEATLAYLQNPEKWVDSTSEGAVKHSIDSVNEYERKTGFTDLETWVKNRQAE